MPLIRFNSDYRFKKGAMTIKDQFRSSRPSTVQVEENVSKIRNPISENRRRTTDTNICSDYTEIRRTQRSVQIILDFSDYLDR